MKKRILLGILCIGMLTLTNAQQTNDHKDDFVKLIQAAKTDFAEVIGEKKKGVDTDDLHNCSLTLESLAEGIIKKANEKPKCFYAFYNTDKSNFSEYIAAGKQLINVLILSGDKSANYKLTKNTDAEGETTSILTNADGYIVLKTAENEIKKTFVIVIFAASSKIK